jgi:hypothetical protein
VVSAEKRNRTWVMRIEGERRRRYTIEADLRAMRRPFRPCRLRANRRRARFRYQDGVLRTTVTGRRIRLEARPCRR